MTTILAGVNMDILKQRNLYEDEAGRLRALQALGLLDTPPESEFDELVQLAAEVCGTPVSLVSLVDRERQWFKAAFGLEVRETHRDLSFCSHAIRQPDLFVIEDAELDPRFAHNALVTGDPLIRFYAGMPLETPEGFAIGTLCVIDKVPRHLTQSQESALLVLARQVTARMQMRMQQRALKAALEQKEEIERGLKESESLFRLFMNHSPFASYIKDGEGRMLFYNQTLADRFGVDQDAWMGRTDAEIWPAEVATSFRHNDLKVLQSGRQMEVIDHTTNAAGEAVIWRSYKFPYRNLQGQMMLAGISVDITEELKRKKELEDANIRLEQLATIDGLTGLKNRRAFEERLQVEFSTAKRRDRDLSVMMIDIDDFKLRNDTWGHAAGDAVLRQLGAILSHTVRLPDIAARYGGEEFIVLLPETSAENVMVFARRLKANIADESWEHTPVTVSFGVATLDAKMSTAEQLVQVADRGLYAAKRAGKNQILAGVWK
ncbi:hypothetical protein BH10ACI4_BH10ACI4_20200 [soil metagenome]